MNVINPDVFTFYQELKENNTREWFEPQKQRFKELEGEVNVFNEGVKEGLELNDEIEKVKMFRIYRDVRFSKNKTPYKTHFGISFHRKKTTTQRGVLYAYFPRREFHCYRILEP
jgi:uncharacterized protein (TIGR02453 family)